MYTPTAIIEIFHLMFLRQFSAQIDSNLYAVKGGCNLRFFFNSIRYSEDLDLDIRTIQMQTLKSKVDKILASLPLLKLLQGYGVTQISFSAPKQTETTQRWKIQLQTSNSELPLHTKIEFSRRADVTERELGSVGMRICQAYGLSPTRLSHYGHDAAVAQKVLALANRTLTQARDIFDLYHLLHISKPQAAEYEPEVLAKAQEALASISFADYKSQVVNFMEIDQQEIYDSDDYWQTISNQVFQYLSELER